MFNFTPWEWAFFGTVIPLLVLGIIWNLFSRRKNMGGENEAMLKPDKDKVGAASPALGETVILHPDQPPQAPANTPPPPQVGVPKQTQAIRTHLNAGQVHLHCDEQQLKVAIPAAEWYVILRKLRSLEPFTWVDPDFKCVAYLRPFIANGMFDVAIELAPVNISARFEQVNQVAGKR